MEWKDKGLILGIRKHAETNVIAEIMTEKHGRHLGLVRGGRSSRMRAVLQVGNSVDVVWRARLSEHLGTYQIEGDVLRAAELMELPLGIYGIQTIASHLRLLPERDPHIGLYNAALVILDHLDEAERAARLLIRFEIALLEELGFGLDLSCCASSGGTEELCWVSPKSGRAVSRAAGVPYEQKLLALPGFLVGERKRDILVPKIDQASENNLKQSFKSSEIENGFKLAFYFLERHVYATRGLRPPDERSGMVKRVLQLIDKK